MKTTGYRCDCCGLFQPSDTPNVLPLGWVTFAPQATTDEERQPEAKHLCGNECLTIIAVERLEAERGKSLSRIPRRASA